MGATVTPAIGNVHINFGVFLCLFSSLELARSRWIDSHIGQYPQCSLLGWLHSKCSVLEHNEVKVRVKLEPNNV